MFTLCQLKPRLLFAGILAGIALTPCAWAAAVTLLNVSYDPTREFYQQINVAFQRQWRSQSPDTLTLQQSHGGSGKQARSVIDGLRADVVTLALAYDIDAIASHGGLIKADWQKRFPHNSSPYTSTIVFLVRRGNPKNIRDWDDLARPGVAVITPNPRTSGGARWNYLAAYGYALKKFEGDREKAVEFLLRVFKNVPVLDSGARAATTTFVQRGIGDVLVAWENEAMLSFKESGQGNVQIVMPSMSILAEPPVAVVDRNVERAGTRRVAEAYLQFLYSEEGQEIAARNHFRPRSETVSAKFKEAFKPIQLFTIDEQFGGWQKAHADHFGENGTFETIQRRLR